MDSEAVRTFVAVAEHGRFLPAADELGITQQAVSKRIAALERELGVRLLIRSSSGSGLTVDGQAFLPHARELVRVARRASASVRPGERALRIDVLNRRIAPANALFAFHRRHPEIELDVVTLTDTSLETALAAVADGTIDATFRAILGHGRRVPAPLRSARVIDDRHQLLVGPGHPSAVADRLAVADLREHRIRMPGLRADTEWGGYYERMARAFGLRIDTAGPSFGVDALLEEVAGSAEVATLVGEGTRYLWPESYDLRRIPIVDPTPVYPHSVVWRTDNTHPGLRAFLDHLRSARRGDRDERTWTPAPGRSSDGTKDGTKDGAGLR